MASGSPGGLAARLTADIARLDAELAEIDLLIAQATAEAERHEQKRAAGSERLAAMQSTGEAPAAQVELATSLVAVTQRAAVMQSQVEALSGKHAVLTRYRDALTGYIDALEAVGAPGVIAGPGPTSSGDGRERAAAAETATGSAASSRLVLAAQEELRREIARAMHDGPAQSLTNIVLQAQIVGRLVEHDPPAALAEVRELEAMVQRTLDATKSFIFEVRPMVLDDLGLVPTLRGAARDRGRRAGVPVTFESFGADRRLPTDLESGLFRLLDDALAAYLALHPDQVSLRLDWSEHLEATLTAERTLPAEAEPPPLPGASPVSKDLPPALAAMIAERRDVELAAREEERRAREAFLSADVLDEIRARAAALGATTEVIDRGAGLRIVADLDRVSGASATE